MTALCALRRAAFSGAASCLFVAANLALAEADPLVVLTFSSPLLRPPNETYPSFALYSDGEMIYSGKEGGYRHTRLSPEARDHFVARLSLAKIPDESGGDMSIYDPPTLALHDWLSGSKRTVEFRGSPDHVDGVPREEHEAFVKAYLEIAHVSAQTEGTAWLPEQLEVLLQKEDTLPGPDPPSWPTRWPEIASATHGADGWRRLTLPASEYVTLMPLVGRGRVRSKGRDWQVLVRLPFPREELWRPTGRRGR